MEVREKKHLTEDAATKRASCNTSPNSHETGPFSSAN